jgi:D-alanine-D-alanine ligase
MRVGLVYDLRDDYLAQGHSEEATAEFDTLATIDAVAGGLTRVGAAVERVGSGRALAARLVAGERFDLVFSIAEGLKGRAREAQVPALCELFDQPYAFSDPLTMAATLDKAVAKRLVRDAGVATAPFAVLERPEDGRHVELAFPVFVKPVAEGTGKGCGPASRAKDRRELVRAAAAVIDRFGQPALVEPFLPGREFTVGIIGNGEAAEVIAAIEIVVNTDIDDGLYSYANKEMCEERVIYRLAAYRALGCRDACRIDFRSDAAGQPQFLEANPIAGLNPGHSDLPILTTLAGRSYEWLMAEILAAAAARYGIAFAGREQRRAAAQAA